MFPSAPPNVTLEGTEGIKGRKVWSPMVGRKLMPRLEVELRRECQTRPTGRPPLFT